MGLQASRTVTGPTGTWELYVSRFVMPTWKQGLTYGPRPEFGSQTYGESLRGDEKIWVEDKLRESTSFALGRYLVDTVRAIAGVFGSSARYIEAVNWDPPVERIRWTTTREGVERVLDDITDGFKEGKVAQPLGAVFLGGKQDHAG